MLIHNNSQVHIKPVALQSLHCKRLLPLAPQLTHNSTVNPHFNKPFALQMPAKILRPQIVALNQSLHKSHSKFVPNALQKSDNKECEQSEELYLIKPIIDTKSCNQHKFIN